MLNKALDMFWWIKCLLSSEFLNGIVVLFSQSNLRAASLIAFSHWIPLLKQDVDCFMKMLWEKTRFILPKSSKYGINHEQNLCDSETSNPKETVLLLEVPLRAVCSALKTRVVARNCWKNASRVKPNIPKQLPTPEFVFCVLVMLRPCSLNFTHSRSSWRMGFLTETDNRAGVFLNTRRVLIGQVTTF